MADKTIYERSHPGRSHLANGQALGRITAVNITKRVCTVKTFHGPSHLVDLSLKNVQWADWDTNAEGDEATAIPREKSIGIVTFIEGEAFIHGYINALQDDKGAITGKETGALFKGDKILATKAGNRIIVRASGALEFISKDTLKTTYIPTDSRLITLCRNFNFKTDGGYVIWEGDDVGQTLHTAEYRQNLARTSVVLEKKGNVGGTTVYSREIGAGIPGTAGVPGPIYKKSYDLTGTTVEEIGPSGASVKIEKNVSGSVKHELFSNYEVLSKLGNFIVNLDAGSAEIVAKLGDILLEATAGHLQIHSLQDTAILSDAGNVDVEATAGDVMLNGSLAKMKLSKGKVAIGGPAAELLDLFDQFIDVVKTVFDAMAQETHIGNLGYSTSPPTNASMYVQGSALAAQIKALLGTIKGSL